MTDNKKHDYSDSYTTYMPEEARGSLLDQVMAQTDRAMGRRHIYLNKEEQKEHEMHRNKEMFENLIAGLTPDEQYIMRVQYGYIPITEPERTRNYDDIHWFSPNGMGLEEGMVRLPNGLNILFVRQFGDNETKLVSVYREKDGAMISPQQFQELVDMDVNYHGDYDTETINQIISNIQKLDKHAHKSQENDTKESELKQVSSSIEDVKAENIDLQHLKDNIPPEMELRGVGALGDSITWEKWQKRDMNAEIQKRREKGNLTEEQVSQIETMIFNLPNNKKEEKTSSLDPEMQYRILEANKKYMDSHYKDYNPFALNEDGILKDSSWQQVYDAYQNLVFTDDKDLPLSAEEQQKTKETLLHTAFYAAEMQFLMDTDISKPKDVRYKEALYDALTVGVYATAYGREITSLGARKANGDKGMGSLAIDVVMHEGPRPIKQSSVINYAAVVNSTVEHKYNQIEKNQEGKQTGILHYLKNKINTFNTYMQARYPESWKVTKRLANVMSRTIKNVAIYTTVGAIAGPAGLGLLAVKSAYDSYTGLQAKARNENMSLKDYVKAHKGETIQAFATSGLSIAMNAIGMGALGEQVATAVMPHLATATRVMAVAPNALKAAKHGMKAFLTKIGLRNDDIEKEKRLAKEAITQTAEATLGMIIGAGVNQAISGVEANAATPEPNVPEGINSQELGGEAAEHLGLNQIHDTDVNGNPLDPTIQQNIANTANPELSKLNQMVTNGEATVEFHHQQGVSSAVYQHENGTTIVSSDIGANPNGSLTITNESHVTTEQTIFNLDGSITTTTTDNMDHVTYTETHDSAGNIIHQEFTNSETGQPVDMTDGFNKEDFSQTFETDLNGTPLNQEVQQNISNTVEGLVEHLEGLKAEHNGASLYDSDKGISTYTCHIGDETYTINRDDSFKCSGETTIAHTNSAGEIQSVTLHPDGRITGDMELYKQIQQHTANNQQIETQQTQQSVNTVAPEVSAHDQQFWDNRADKFLGEETTNRLYERIESGEIKLPEGIESKEEFAYKLAMAMEQTPTYVTETLGTEWQTSAQLEAGISSMSSEQFAQLSDLMNSFDDRGNYLGAPQIVEYTSTNDTQIQKEAEAQITTSEQIVDPVVSVNDTNQVRNEEYWQQQINVVNGKHPNEVTLEEMINTTVEHDKVTAEQGVNFWMEQQVELGRLTPQQAEELGVYVNAELDIRDNYELDGTVNDDGLNKHKVHDALNAVNSTLDSMHNNAQEVLIADNLQYTPHTDLPPEMRDTQSYKFYNGMSEVLGKMIEGSDKPSEIIHEALENGKLSEEQATIMNTRYSELRAEGHNIEDVLKIMQRDYDNSTKFYGAQALHNEQVQSQNTVNSNPETLQPSSNEISKEEMSPEMQQWEKEVINPMRQQFEQDIDAMRKQHFNGVRDDIYNVGQNVQQEHSQASIQDKINELRGRSNSSSSHVLQPSHTHMQENSNIYTQVAKQKLSVRS